jgi:DNA-binding NarL/FixJ family response regulator
VKIMSSRVLVVEGHPVTRWGLSRLIDEQDGLDLVGQTGTAEEAVKLAAALHPDVVIIGLGQPDQNGLRLARHLRDRFDDLGIVLLAAAEEDDVLLRAFETGVSAFVAKSAPVTELMAAVRHASVAASSFTAVGLAVALRRQREAATPSYDLSARERQVLDLLVDGESVPSLARCLHISPSTAKTHVARIYEKLGVRTRAEAVMAAVRLGLADASAVAIPASVEEKTARHPVESSLASVIPAQASRRGASHVKLGSGAV